MSRYISPTVRQTVAKRAQFRCEYCKIFERYAFLPFHIEHIISIKHGGQSTEDNLAYACSICNLNKGSDIATIIEKDIKPIRFFHPRIDNWTEHFKVENTGIITPLTNIGKATIKIFKLNHPESIIERYNMIQKNIF